MIPIRRTNLEQIALHHYECIARYFQNKKSGRTINQIDTWIKNAIGDEYNFKTVILAKPKELKTIAGKWIEPSKDTEEATIAKYFKETLYGYLSCKSKVVYRDIDGNSYLSYHIGKALGILVCPYCNENYTYSISETNERTFQLDHFYPKSEYSILSISFYNLIPSCAPCNRIKEEMNNSYPHPYDFSNSLEEEVKFKLNVVDYNIYDDLNAIELELSCPTNNDMQALISDLNLNKRYQHHKDIVLEVIHKGHIYNRSYIEELQNNFPNILDSDSVVHRYLLGKYVDNQDVEKRPLSKLVKDISEQILFGLE